MKYIAYGSNMNLEQMAIRCPGAKLIGTGLLHGYRLEFNRHATIVPTNKPDDAVPVAVWGLRRWLEEYSVRIALSPWIFLAAGLFAAVVALLSVGWQSRRAADADPIESLKN